MINETRFAFFDFDMSSKIHSFPLALSSETIAIDELDVIAPKLHTYTTFFLFNFIFRQKLHVVNGYRFFICSVYLTTPDHAD